VARRAKTAKRISGGAGLKARGLRAMLLGWPQEDREKIEQAAQADGRPMTQFVMFHALRAAESILRKSNKSA
jgi:hypothetical protein